LLSLSFLAFIRAVFSVDFLSIFFVFLVSFFSKIYSSVWQPASIGPHLG